ncbi:sugar phosphate isomerase/epimerase family protein [Streptomyces umbrinus]|uniref:sugar phosphate isomerase/epimerase family protein n=2 Tax=Streptomyces umbrinus TaxID=67370 RepID=UPI0034338FD8
MADEGRRPAGDTGPHRQRCHVERLTRTRMGQSQGGLRAGPTSARQRPWTGQAIDACRTFSSRGGGKDGTSAKVCSIEVGFLCDFRDRIYRVDRKEARKRLDGRNGRLGSHLPWGDPRRGWEFVSAGHGNVPWEDVFRMLRSIGYDGPNSVEWEDAGMDRLMGAPQALAHLKRFDVDPPSASFDAAFGGCDN